MLKKVSVSFWFVLFGLFGSVHLGSVSEGVCKAMILLPAGVLASTCQGLPQEDEDPDEPLFIRFYRIGDLLATGHSKPFDGVVVPGMQLTEGPRNRLGGMFSIPANSVTMPQAGAGMGGGMGGRMGGMGGMAPGFFGDADLNQSPFGESKLISLVQSMVAPESWILENGEGELRVVGQHLIVLQTARNHEVITEFFAEMRRMNQAVARLRVQLVWLHIDEPAYQAIAAEKELSWEFLNRVAGKQLSRANLLTLDSQTTHLVAGDLSNAIDSVVPIVGQNSPAEDIDRHRSLIAQALGIKTPTSLVSQVVSGPLRLADHQVLDSSPSVISLVSRTVQDPNQAFAARTMYGAGGSAVGYQPQIRWVNFGGVVEITPRLTSQTGMVYIDLTSHLAWPSDPKFNLRSSVGAPKATGDLVDQQHFRNHYFSTSTRIPLGQPVLVGGHSNQPNLSGGPQTYLVLQIDIE